MPGLVIASIAKAPLSRLDTRSPVGRQVNHFALETAPRAECQTVFAWGIASGLPVDARAAFETTRSALLQLLGTLEAAKWTAPTVASPWAVRDIVAHLLGDDVARLSRSRDGHPTLLESDFPASLHRANARWVAVLHVASPAVLVELLQAT
jgi:Mycothiol maleylpyruvate isomerase N-terminal domain